MKNIYLFCVTFALFGSASVDSLNLLLVFPLPSKSHYFLGNELGKGLAKLGHQVTIVAAFEEKNPPENYREIVLQDLRERRESDEELKNTNMFEMENVSPIFQLAFLTHVGNLFGDIFFNHTKIQDLLKSNEHFDAVIIEQFWNDAMKVLAWRFNAHLIMFSTVGPVRWVNNLVANPENPSYIPDVLLSGDKEMSLYERTYNLIFGQLHDLLLYNYFYPSQNAIVQKYFPEAPHLSDILYNITLVLANSHESTYAAVPHVPNIIDIGGFHVNPPKELPQDIRQLMENAKEGVIYFSMGSNLVPSMMPKKTKEVILKVLGARKEKILWKWDEDKLENQPKNVMISKWFPQQAILAHPNCKLFITHGGLLSLTETVTMGKPVLAFPIFGDQKMNAKRIITKGLGLAIAFSQINENNLANTLEELLSNPFYRENAEQASKLMHDRPMKPLEVADYWIKYVVRHNGAPHLRVSAISTPLYKYYMLDVFGVIFTFILIAFYVLVKMFAMFCKCFTSNKLKKD